MLHDSPVVDAVLFIAVLIPSVVLHEIAHGAVALRFGDPTARDAGRLTLNPVRHVDPFGSLLLPAMLALARMNVFGWAKPVPVNPARFARPVGHMAVTALAGPATNVLLAFAAARLGPFRQVDGVLYMTSDGPGARLMLGFLVVNAALAVFNMLPIPPLDGSRLLPLMLSRRARVVYDRVGQYGFIILILLLFVFRDSLNFLTTAIVWLIRVVA